MWQLYFYKDDHTHMLIHSHWLFLKGNDIPLSEIYGPRSFLLNLGWLMSASNSGGGQKWCYVTSKAKMRKKKKYNSQLWLFSLSLSLLEPSHHIMRNLKPNWEATCEFSCRQPHQASSQHLHQPPEMWKITIHIISVPNLESSSWEPRHHGAETSHPRCMLSEFLNHRNHERPKKFYCF